MLILLRSKAGYEIPADLVASHTGQIAANSGIMIDMLKRLITDFLEIFGPSGSVSSYLSFPTRSPSLASSFSHRQWRAS